MSCDPGGSPSGIQPLAIAPACLASASVAYEFVCALIPEHASATVSVPIVSPPVTLRHRFNMQAS
jgi:hypothetical protein